MLDNLCFAEQDLFNKRSYHSFSIGHGTGHSQISMTTCENIATSYHSMVADLVRWTSSQGPCTVSARASSASSQLTCAWRHFQPSLEARNKERDRTETNCGSGLLDESSRNESSGSKIWALFFCTDPLSTWHSVTIGGGFRVARTWHLVARVHRRPIHPFAT